MRNALTFILIFAGAAFSVFVLNIVMYTVLPDYHDVVSSAFATSEEIPVVYPEETAKEITGPEVPLAPTAKGKCIKIICP